MPVVEGGTRVAGIVAARLVRAVEGVGDVDRALMGPRRAVRSRGSGMSRRPNRRTPGGRWGARAGRVRYGSGRPTRVMGRRGTLEVAKKQRRQTWLA
jgi:hypothetical protein